MKKLLETFLRITKISAIYQKFSGKGMFFSCVEDDFGNDRNACILLENLKSHESIIKMIQRFGADEFIEKRCYFYIVSGNKNSLEILEKRIKTYRRKIIGADGVFVKYEEHIVVVTGVKFDGDFRKLSKVLVAYVEH